MTPAAVGGVAPAALRREHAEARAAASPEWLAARRRAAWDAFEAMPMPSSQRDEDWRRTDISALRVESFRPLEVVDGSMVAAMRDQRDRAAPGSAFIVDAPAEQPGVEGADELQAQGIIVTSLEDASRRHPELVLQALSHVAVDETKFIALWNALWRGGVFIHVPAGVEASVPVWIAHPVSGPDVAVFPTTVVVLEQSASLALVDAYASPRTPDEMLSDALAMLTLGRDARLDYIALQQLGHGAWHVATHRARLDANARLRFFGATFGSRLQKSYWEAILDGTGAEAELGGLCFGDDVQHLDHQSLQAHVGAETRSDLALKVAVRDRARSVYTGLIDVAHSAVHADGYVQNRNLILSHGAKADSVPRLEIKANDVRCGHGATAGHIDDDQRFYFMSRGVRREEADALIIRAFMEDVLDRVPLQSVREHIGDLLDGEIAQQSQAGLAEETL